MKKILILTLFLYTLLSSVGVSQTSTFNISLRSNSLSVVQGRSGTLSLTITPVNNFTGTVNLSLSNPPRGINLRPTSLNVRNVVTQNITISVDSSVAVGRYTLTLRVVSGSIARTATISLTVTSPPEPNFEISITPLKITVPQGGSTVLSMNLVPSGGFSGTVRLELQNSPIGLTLTPSSFGVGRENVSQKIHLNASNNVSLGSYNIRIRAISGNIVKTVNLEVVVTYPSGSLIWSKQFGTNTDDDIYGLTIDSENNIILVGSTNGYLDDGIVGLKDVFVRKYSSEGTLLLGRQFGTVRHDEGYDVAVDTNDNIIVVGYTYGTLGKESAELVDVFVRKFNKDGIILWTTQFGTNSSEVANTVAVDRSGNIYVAGYTWGSLEGDNKGAKDAHISKLDSDGNILWIRQFGTEFYDEAFNLAVDNSGNIYVAGYTWGTLSEKSFGSQDIFVAKFNSSGTLIWISQFGTDKLDEPRGLVLDNAGNIYISGYTNGALFAKKQGTNDIDVILVKLDKNGKIVFGVQVGSSPSSEGNFGQDSGLDIAINSEGKIVVVGWTNGNLAGNNQGYEDSFVRLFDQSEKIIWTKQFGTRESDIAQRVVFDREGNIVVVGTTYGNLEERNKGGKDIFIRKYAP